MKVFRNMSGNVARTVPRHDSGHVSGSRALFATPVFPLAFPDALRILFIAYCLFVTWVGATPFADLTDVAVISTSEEGNNSNQIAYALMGLLAFGVIFQSRLRYLAPLAAPPLLMIALWFFITTSLSSELALSARRSVALYFTVAAAIATLLITRDKRQFAYAFGGAAFVVLLVCYASLIIVPDLAIHTANEIREPEHAGNWRGLFSHKNAAGAVMTEFIFIGLFATKVANRKFGLCLLLFSSIFLLFTMSKTPMALLVIIFIQVELCRKFKMGWLRAFILLSPVIILFSVSVGPLFVAPLKTFMQTFFPGVTFTGRTEIWEFSAENILKKPWTGYGFGAFWQTSAVFYGASDKITWVNSAGHAHNAYLDTLLFLGVPGFILTIFWLIIMPIRDLQKQVDGLDLKSEHVLFLQIWLFNILSAAFEGKFYIMGNGFFTVLIAVLGLRFGTKARFI